MPKSIMKVSFYQAAAASQGIVPGANVELGWNHTRTGIVREVRPDGVAVVKMQDTGKNTQVNVTDLWLVAKKEAQPR